MVFFCFVLFFLQSNRVDGFHRSWLGGGYTFHTFQSCLLAFFLQLLNHVRRTRIHISFRVLITFLGKIVFLAMSSRDVPLQLLSYANLL